MPPSDHLAELARARMADRVRGKLMQSALKALLDPVPGARGAFPHLAALEEALGRQGVSAIDEVPLQWLAKITTQLGSLPLRDDDHELQDLLSRLCSAVERQQRPRPPAPEPEPAGPEHDSNYLSDFHDSARMEVREVSHSQFIQEFEALRLESETVAQTPRSNTP
jgi:hypothetical protein